MEENPMKRNTKRSGPPSPETGKYTVRERTLAHMEELMHKATTVGAGIILACGAKAQALGPTQVVDPLPTPVGCCENPEELILRGCLDQQARWVKSGMRWTVQLSLSANAGPTRVSFEGLKRDAIKVIGLSIKDVKVEPRKVGFVLAAGASNRQATLQFPVLCNGKKIALKLVLDLSKTPMEDGSVPVRLAK
jgi:hypothetical protein